MNMTLLQRAVRRDGKFLNPVPTRVGGFSMIFKLLPLYLANREEKVPREPLGPFRTDAQVYATPPQSGLRVTWFGHSSMLLEIDGVRVLIDPVWDKRAAPSRWVGPKRFFPPTLPLHELPPIDVVLVSHDHYDHLGKATIQGLSRLPALANAQWVTSLGVGKRLAKFGVAKEHIRVVDWTQTVSLANGGCAITSLPARHFSGRGLFDRFKTLWASFVIQDKHHTVYYGADSGLWEGFAEIAAKHGPFDLTMLEIGAFNELWKAIHMGPDGAAALHGWRQPIERMMEIASERGWPLFAPEPGSPTEVAVRQSDWWRRP
jgi:L-ascorbate metabolism protein UlaG (beta-lactamase superfamily)